MEYYNSWINGNPCNKPNVEPRIDKHPEPKPCDKHEKHQKPKKDDCCCCSGSYRRALLLLNDPTISAFIRFNTLGLIGKNYTVGGNIEVDVGDDRDNFFLNVDLEDRVTLQCVECNLVKISATNNFLYPSVALPGAGEAIPVDPLNYWSLCDLDVVLLQVNDDNFPDTGAITSWDTFKAFFRNLLDNNQSQYGCHKNCDDCCCSEDIVNQLNTCVFGNQGNIVNLTAGAWRGQGLEVLGRIGCILVLTNNFTIDDNNPSLFFVCLNSVGGIYNL